MTAEDYTQAAALVTEECHRALTAIEPEKVLEYLDMLTSAKRVFFVGVGRVLLSLESIAKRYAHLGIDTVIALGAGLLLWVCIWRKRALTRPAGIVMLIAYLAYFMYLM